MRRLSDLKRILANMINARRLSILFLCLTTFLFAQDIREKQSWSIIERAYNDKNYSFLLFQAKTYFQQYPEGHYADRVALYKIVALYEGQKFKEALQAVLGFQETYADSAYLARVSLYEIKIYYATEKWQNALDLIDNYSDKYSDKIDLVEEAVRMQILSYFKLGRRDDLEAMVRDVSKTTQNELWLDLANLALQDEGQPERALAYYQKAKAEGMGRDFQSRYSALGLHLNFLRDRWSGLKSSPVDGYRQSFPSSPYLPQLYLDELNWYLFNKNTSAIKSRLEKYNNLFNKNSPLYPDYLYALARYEEIQNQWVLASEKYEQLRQFPEFEELALIALLRMYEQRELPEKKQDILEQLSKMAGDERAALAKYSLAEQNLVSDPEKSLQYFKDFSTQLSRLVNGKELLMQFLLKFPEKNISFSRALDYLNISKSALSASSYIDLTVQLNEDYGLMSQSSDAIFSHLQTLLQEKAFEDSETLMEQTAFLALQKKDYRLSKNYYEILRRSFNNSIKANAYFGLAELARVQKNYDEAVRAYRQFVLNFPADRRKNEALFQIGKSYYFQNDYEQALESLASVDSSSGFFRQSLYWQAWSEVKTADLEEAKKNFLAVTQTEPGYRDKLGFDSMTSAAKLAFNLGQTEEARTIYQDMFAEFENLNSEQQNIVFRQYFELLLSVDKLENASRLLSRSSWPLERLLPFHLQLADAFFSRSRYSLAASAYEKVLSLLPESETRVWYFYAYALDQSQGGQIAKSFYEKYLASGDKKYAEDARLRLSQIAMDEGNEEKGEELLETVRKSSNASLAKEAERLEQERRENKTLKSIPRMTTTDLLGLIQSKPVKRIADEASYTLAMRYYEQGDYQKAVEYFEQAAIHNNDKKAAQSLSYLVEIAFQANRFDVAYQKGMSFYYLYEQKYGNWEKMAYFLAESAYQLGVMEQANRFKDLLLQVYPDSSFIKELSF